VTAGEVSLGTLVVALPKTGVSVAAVVGSPPPPSGGGLVGSGGWETDVGVRLGQVCCGPVLTLFPFTGKVSASNMETWRIIITRSKPRLTIDFLKAGMTSRLIPSVTYLYST